MVDKSEPVSNLILVYGLLLAVLLFGLVIGLAMYFQRVKFDQYHAKVELAPTEQLNNLRDYENQMLNGYALLQQSDSRQVRIPIDRAMALQATDPLPNAPGLPPDAPLPAAGAAATTGTAASAPAQASAPTTGTVPATGTAPTTAATTATTTTATR